MVAASLPPEIDDETRASVAAAADTLGMGKLMPLIADAQRARALLDSGDRAGALAVIEPHRQMAESVGLGPLFDSMMSSVLAE